MEGSSIYLRSVFKFFYYNSLFMKIIKQKKLENNFFLMKRESEVCTVLMP